MGHSRIFPGTGVRQGEWGAKGLSPEEKAQSDTRLFGLFPTGARGGGRPLHPGRSPTSQEKED